jgi:N-acetylneuraminate synthase/N,N'-diacetyllegionaminate synthase
MLAINNRSISSGHPTYIIAEMGINHNGQVEIARQMVESACDCGVDAVKVQIITADASYVKDCASYPIFKKNELNFEEWEDIIRFVKHKNLDVFSTIVNPYDIQYVERFELPAIKISSTSITNFPLLEEIGRLKKPVIMSTGMAFLSEVDEAVRYLEKQGQPELGLLHCTSLYPTPPEHLNLKAIQMLQSAFPDYTIGFSDHTVGYHCAVAAVACGASIIEKHFTMDKQMNGPDHSFSATPDELKTLVQAIREVESALGSTRKQPAPKELSLRKEFQRSLVAAVDIKQGQRLTPELLVPKRTPKKGIKPKHLDIVCGRRVQSDIPKDSPIIWDLI